jgi:hypothetical protein
MPDYASILRRSVAALPDPTVEMREAVYQRARAALARQLTAVDPPLSTREIENQHQELEDAVVRLEAEFAPQEEPAAAFTAPARKDDFLYSAPQTTLPERRPAPPPPVNEFSDETPAGAAYEEDDDDFEEEDRRSRIPALVGILCVVLVVIGAGAYVYAERETLFGLASSGTAGDELAAAGPVRVLAPDAEDDPDKRPDRLTNGTEVPPVSPAPDSAAASVPPPPAAEATTPADGAQLDNLAGLQGQATGGLEEPATSLVEQRAIYYFQGAEGQAGQASEGTATWAETTKDNHPAIQATIRIAERNVTATVTIYKNYDTTLPASHLVEVQFSGTLSESPILRVPALVLKQTEQARGQPLAGAAVPVTNELFWIALSNEADESVRNVQLLGEGSWFDIPILFNDQTRALITFEKGIPGDKVFETVMASWTPA